MPHLCHPRGPRRARLAATRAMLALAAVLAGTRAAAQRPASGPPADLQQFDIWQSDAYVEFSVPFLFTRVRGRFDQVFGTVLYSPSEPQRSSVAVVAGTKSLTTGVPSRDDHLRSDDFFDAERYPVIAFRSTSVRPTSDGFLVTGVLSLHGVTRAVSLPLRAVYPLAWDTAHASVWMGFEGSMRLSRRDFGIAGGAAHNSWFDEARQRTVPDSVDVSIRVDLTRVDYARRRRAETDAELARRLVPSAAAAADAYRRRRAAGGAVDADFEGRLGTLGLALLDRGRVDDALELLRLDAELHPGASDAHAALGLAYVRAGRSALALAAYRRALAADPNETRALAMLPYLEGATPP